MNTITLNDAKITFLPIIKGLKSDYDKVKEQLNSNYDSIALALGIEDIEIIKKSDTEEWEYDPTDLDSVYAHHLKKFGEIELPVPGFKAAIDYCKDNNLEPFPLDYCDKDFTDLYCEKIGVFDLLKEKRILKKSMKTNFSEDSAEEFVIQWDNLVNEIKGQHSISLLREEHMAKELIGLSKYKKNIVAVVEYERIKGILIELGVSDGM